MMQFYVFIIIHFKIYSSQHMWDSSFKIVWVYLYTTSYIPVTKMSAEYQNMMSFLDYLLINCHI